MAHIGQSRPESVQVTVLDLFSSCLLRTRKRKAPPGTAGDLIPTSTAFKCSRPEESGACSLKIRPKAPIA